jgi:hypothetical protein
VCARGRERERENARSLASNLPCHVTLLLSSRDAVNYVSSLVSRSSITPAIAGKRIRKY